MLRVEFEGLTLNEKERVIYLNIFGEANVENHYRDPKLFMYGWIEWSTHQQVRLTTAAVEAMEADPKLQRG